MEPYYVLLIVPAILVAAWVRDVNARLAQLREDVEHLKDEVFDPETLADWTIEDEEDR